MVLVSHDFRLIDQVGKHALPVLVESVVRGPAADVWHGASWQSLDQTRARMCSLHQRWLSDRMAHSCLQVAKEIWVCDKKKVRRTTLCESDQAQHVPSGTPAVA